MSLRNVATIVLILTLVAVVALTVVHRKKKQQEPDIKVPEGCPEYEPDWQGQPDVGLSDPDMEKKVFLGEYGTNVAFLQHTLNSSYGASIKVDGKAGCNTFDAVYAYAGLNLADGVDLNDLKTSDS